MKVFIFTLGTRGDVQPYVALGRGLKSAGHRVTLCTSATFETFVTGNGLEFGPFNDEFMKLINSEAGRSAIERTSNLWGLLRTARILAKESARLQSLMMSDGWEAARAADPDLIVFHPKAYGGLHFAEKLGVPAAMALAMPAMVPTGEHPALGFPAWRLGASYNRLTYRVIGTFMRRSFGKHIEAWRREHGLAPQTRGRDLLHTQAGAPIPVLHGYSRHVAPVPADWPPQAVVTGYWFLDRLENWKPTAGLQEFLEAGDPPVYIGFGSMTGNRARDRTRIVLAALKEAQVRGVMATGWGGLSSDALPPTVFSIEHAPHDWLFPRMAGVLHHGGAGTTAAGLRAGQPTVICPFIGDQPFWGRCVHARGAGPAPIPHKQLTVAALARALGQAVTDPSMRQAARALGERIRAEDGVASAVALLERMAAQATSSAPSSVGIGQQNVP